MKHPRALLLALIVLAAACGAIRDGAPGPGNRPSARPTAAIWQQPDERGPSHAIFPTQTLPLKFDHARHLAISGLRCVACHTTARESTSASDRLVPPESTCTPCHDIHRDQPLREARPAARCDACHEGYDPARPARVARVEIPEPNLRFSHQAHVAAGSLCEDCHGAMTNVTLGTRLDLPTMRSCFGCHREGGRADAACATCHLTGADGRLITRFAEGAMNPPTWMTGLHHDADFWVNHRSVGPDDEARCGPCHAERDCEDCHDGRVRDRRNHPNDYVSLHAAEARAEPETCNSCHRTTSFCVECHLRSGVSESSATAARAGGRFHPPAAQWSSADVGPGHHAIEARRALTTCVSCHTERDCTTCHAATGMGGAGISPHPPGWLSRCAPLLAASPRACAQCHDDMASIEARCR